MSGVTMPGNRSTDGTADDSGRAEAAEGVTSPVEGARAGRETTDDPTGPNEQPPTVYSLRLAISLFAILGYVIVFGAAVSAVGALVRAPWARELYSFHPVKIFFPGATLLPLAAFLFVVQFEDVELTRPEWLDGHPSIADAWLLVFGTTGVLAIALSEFSAWISLLAYGWLATGAVAFLGLPLWLARRCLRRPSWVIGCVSVLLGVLLVFSANVALLTFSALVRMGIPPLERAAVAVGVAIVGTAVPYGLVYVSPGSERLAIRTAELLSRLQGGIGAVVRRT